MKTQCLLHWTTIFFSCHSPQGFLELRSAWSCVNLGIQELVAMWSTSQQVITGNDLQIAILDLIWCGIGASSSYGQTCDGARLLTWGVLLLSDNAEKMQFDAGVWPCIEAVWKTFHSIFFQDLLMVGHAQNGCNLRFLPTLRSVAHHELHAQGTKHFGLWHDVSTFTFLHSGSGRYFENETFAAKWQMRNNMQEIFEVLLNWSKKISCYDSHCLFWFSLQDAFSNRESVRIKHLSPPLLFRSFPTALEEFISGRCQVVSS